MQVETQIKEWRLQPNTERERERERERVEDLQQNEVKRVRGQKCEEWNLLQISTGGIWELNLLSRGRFGMKRLR
jgi:hypothetical protein